MGAEITNQTRLERQRHYSGPEFLREGFRPLFFLAGLWAALSVPLWIGIWLGAISYPGLGDGTMWHVHEMMFGYVGAALGGFVLTAVPNWTGRPPVRGWPLGALALIWLCGRIAVWWGGTVGAIPTAVADLAYLGVLSVLVGNEIVAGRNWRNLPVLAGLVLMLTANVLFHLSAAGVADVGEAGVRLSIAVMSLLITLIGGRIVPNLTHNWFARRAGPNISAPMGRFDHSDPRRDSGCSNGLGGIRTCPAFRHSPDISRGIEPHPAGTMAGLGDGSRAACDCIACRLLLACIGPWPSRGLDARRLG